MGVESPDLEVEKHGSLKEPEAVIFLRVHTKHTPHYVPYQTKVSCSGRLQSCTFVMPLL